MESLADALIELSGFGQFVYPIQICSLPNTNRDVKFDVVRDTFTVIIGDSIEEIVYWWNRPLLSSQRNRVYMNQLWLPTRLAAEPKVRAALQQWLRKVTAERLHFASFTLSQDELQGIADELAASYEFNKTVSVIDEPQTPCFEDRAYYPLIKQNTDLYRVTSNQEQIVLNEPNVLFGRESTGYWMADIYIQSRPERYGNIIGKDYWWQLPRRNPLVHRIFQRNGRIAADGFPSVLVNRAETTLSFRLPEESSIFGLLITDAKNFKYVQRSDKGRYLSGIVDVFSGLWSAYHTIEQRYWRRMFNLLSHQNPVADKKKQEIILNKLKKKMQAYGTDFQEKPEGLEWLSSYVLQLAKEQAASGKELRFRYFIEEGQKEIEDYNKASNENAELDLEQLKSAISDLVESNILLIGIRPRCPFCGARNWYHVDEARQILKCTGCKYQYPIRPQEEWHYKLNSLVQAAFAQHGLVPVILVLGQLLQDCENFFMFTTSQDLFRDYEDKENVGDLDIVCIQDGKFIIGEIKQSQSLFTKSEFEKMAEIAEAIKPDILLFSSLDLQPNKFVTDNIEAVKKRLAPLDIEVQWYQLNSSIFDPWPAVH